MVENPIKGYRMLSDNEISIINKIKDTGSNIGEMCDLLESLPETDKRWVAIARTDLQKGFMALVRSVAKPDGF